MSSTRRARLVSGPLARRQRSCHEDRQPQSPGAKCGLGAASARRPEGGVGGSSRSYEIKDTNAARDARHSQAAAHFAVIRHERLGVGHDIIDAVGNSLCPFHLVLDVLDGLMRARNRNKREPKSVSAVLHRELPYYSSQGGAQRVTCLRSSATSSLVSSVFQLASRWARSAFLAYGNITSVTNETGLVVPSMSRTRKDDAGEAEIT